MGSEKNQTEQAGWAVLLKLPMKPGRRPGNYLKDRQLAGIMSKTFPERPRMPKISGDGVDVETLHLTLKCDPGPMCSLWSPATSQLRTYMTVRVPADLSN